MRTVPVIAEHTYQVEIGVDWQVALADWVEGRNKVLVITSENFPAKTSFPTFEVPDGEAGKSTTVLQNIWQRLGDLSFNRGDLIVAIGGGTVTDLAGFAAATWLRGIDWLAIPTTVASMVDAAIGGKTGINATQGKNLIGAFHSPVGVLIDLKFIETLTGRDIAAGMAEVVKCGFISDPEILVSMKGKSLKDVVNDPGLQLELIHRAVSVKAAIVGEDFKESYLREILNYGHTLGHAIEKHSGYSLRHGEAVAIGMCFVAELAKSELNLSDQVVELHYLLLKALKLPTAYQKSAWPELVEIMSLDKKVKSGKLRFVAIDAIASCKRIEAPSSEALKSAYERISR